MRSSRGGNNHVKPIVRAARVPEAIRVDRSRLAVGHESGLYACDLDISFGIGSAGQATAHLWTSCLGRRSMQDGDDRIDDTILLMRGKIGMHGKA
jgi:hypothetical protein